MKTHHRIRNKRSESGIALLIAIFAVLLVSALAISLIVASGTETSLAGNYRSSASSYYAAAAGIEEARGRLLPGNPNSIATLLPLAGVPPFLAANQVVYITNPAVGEPNGAALIALYPDNEFNAEFPLTPLAATAKTYFDSVWTAKGNTGPLYKWVRINAATKNSIGVNVDGTGVGSLVLNASMPLYYDSAPTPASMIVPPGLAGVPNPPSSARQAYEITALAVLPNGSQKLLQYVVAPLIYDLNFQGALTLAGQVGNFQGANSNPYKVSGIDGSGNPPAVPGCTNNAATVAGIDVSPGNAASGQTNQDYVIGNLPRPNNYTGTGGTPSVGAVNQTGTLQTPASLDQLVQTIRNNADAVIPNPPNPANYNNSATTYNFGTTGWPTDMSATNPKVVYVDGSFDLGPNTGYGILVVTGNFQYQGNSGWKGIILVIGDGTTTFLGNGGGNGEFDGAIFTATTRDASGNQLSSFGTLNFDITGGGGNGIYYNSCWINKVKQPPTYLVLSFREL